MAALERILARLRKGGMAVIYDGDEREGEADLVIGAKFAKPGTIETMRKDAGGLICLAVPKEDAIALGIPFYCDMLAAANLAIGGMKCSRTAYGDMPAFSISINHRDVFTGITDNDRALTISSAAALLEAGGNGMRERFVSGFYSPGHVFLLIGRGIEKRRGHTELSLELAKRAGVRGGMVLCEMLGSGKALSKSAAREYAKLHGLPFIEGKDIPGPAKKI